MQNLIIALTIVGGLLAGVQVSGWVDILAVFGL